MAGAVCLRKARMPPDGPYPPCTMPPAARTSHSPASHDEDEPHGTGLHSRSRNARAQARHRAKRKAYIENLEANVKRLQAIVDAHGLDPAAPPPPSTTHVPHHQPHPYVIHELQAANDRLRREADEMRLQLDALMSAHVNGAHVTPPPPTSATATPPPDKKRRMSNERDRASIYLDHPGRASPASTVSSMATIASPSLAGSSHTSLSMLPSSTLAQQAAYNSLFTPEPEPDPAPTPSGQSSAGVYVCFCSVFLISSRRGPHPYAWHRPTSTACISYLFGPAWLFNFDFFLLRVHPPPTSTPSCYQNLPSTSLLATSLYPLLTLGIAGGAVSGELGAAAWNAYQQSQLAQAQGQAGSSHMPPPANAHHQPHTSYLSQSQPMSTLSSERIDSASSLQNPLESVRAPSPRFSTSSSPASFGAGPSTSSPRFNPSSFDARFEPSGSRFDAPGAAPRFDPQLDSQMQFGHTSSGSGSGSPHFATPISAPSRTTPPGYVSSSGSTPPAFGQNGRRGSSSNSSLRGDGS
ncbi:bZIP transcription factor [Ceratobasidium sp. AG-Ba]|nr:bZIP transcription factor [Ceratobasidium sp. AG-Ba]